MFYYGQNNSQLPPPPTYSSLADQKHDATAHPSAPAYTQHPPPEQSMGTGYYSQPSQPGQPMGSGYSQPPQPGQPLNAGYAQQPQYGQPIMIQTQPVFMQNQYGQPLVVGGVQPVGAYPLPIPVDPHNPTQNENSVRMKCPHCQQEVTTTTEYVPGGCTWLYCILLAFMGCILCCFLPFLWNGSKDVIHTCPNCKTEVGRFNRQQRSNVRISPAGGHHRRRRRRR